MLLGGLDIGTTGCKLSVYDERGNFIFNAYREYDVTRKEEGHEISAETVFHAVCDVIKETAKEHTLAAIGVTSFGETFAALDENDHVLLPSMLYTDPRGKEESDALSLAMGEKTIARIAGVKPHPMYSLPKIMWIKNHLPETYAKIKRILLMEDFIVYMLTGNATVDYALATRTMAFDIRKKCWSKEILQAASIDQALLSKPVPAGTVAGEIKASLARQLGMKEKVLIVNGAHDQVAAAVGAGIFTAGEAMDGTGTVECIVPVFDHIPEDETLFDEGYAVVPFVFENTYACYALSFTGGAVLKWFRDNFAAKYQQEKNIYAALDAAVSPDPTGILVLPHFAGAANPYMDNGSRAAILGMTLDHTANDLYKALMEGVTYEMMMNIEHLEKAGIAPKKLYATGGGASSDVWLKIKADILNRPITALNAKEVGACGTCMLTGVAIGLYRDLEEAKAVFVKERITYTPDPQRTEAYQRLYRAYRDVYHAVRPIIEKTKQ